MPVNLEIYLVLNTFLCRLAIYANNTAENGRKGREPFKSLSQFEMTDEVWREFSNACSRRSSRSKVK
jgi:hypothetical protein